MKFLRALGLLMGMIIGAGMFALPYTIQRAGLWWTLFHFILAAGIVTTTHILYSNVFIADPRRLRLPGFVHVYFGASAYWVAFLSRLFSYLGYLLAYGVLAGFFLEHFIPRIDIFWLSVAFFLFVAPFLILNLKEAGTINLFLTVPLVLFGGGIFFLVYPHLNVRNVSIVLQDGSWFEPYGIFLFALSGASIIPEVVETIGRAQKYTIRKVIVWGTIVVSVVYVLFSMAIIGVAPGGIVEPDGLSSLALYDGRYVFFLGTLIGFLAIITSHLTLALELRFTFEYDLRLRRFLAWMIVAFLPLVLFVLGINNFVFILSLIGALGIGVEGILIALLARRVARANKVLTTVLIVFLSSGVILELGHIFGRL